jgi:hypothetical protein
MPITPTTNHEQLKSQPTKYCYSTDEENFQHESMGDLLDYLNVETEDKIGATYWKGEKVELSHEDCIDVDSFLEMCDEYAYEELGNYDNCFTDVDDADKAELKALIIEWSKKHVVMRYWKVRNVQELKITAEDLE